MNREIESRKHLDLKSERLPLEPQGNGSSKNFFQDDSFYYLYNKFGNVLSKGASKDRMQFEENALMISIKSNMTILITL